MAIAEDNDNQLKYRESGTKLFGTQNVKVITGLHLSDVTKAGSLAKVIQARTSWLPTANVTSFGSGYVKAWAMPKGWTPGHEFGPTNTGAQIDFDAVKLPVATSYQVQDGTDHVLVTPAQPIYETKTTYICTVNGVDVTVASATTPCPTS